MSAAADDERQARAMLTYINDPGNPLVVAAARAEGAVATLGSIRSGTLSAPGYERGTPQRRKAASSLRERLAQVPPAHEVARWQACGIRLACPGDPEWPPGLDDLGDAAPVALWVSGAADLGSCWLRTVAVTGARACSAYGSYLAAEFSSSLAAQGRTVIAGGAFGIDAAAHRGALSAGGATVVVTASGVNIPYPAGHDELFAAVSVQGAVVSEHPPGVRVSRLRFKARSRIIAALSAGTVVIEAGANSGALDVARHAHELGRPVMAVPGPVTSDLSAGCNGLIRSARAALVASARDVAELLDAADGAAT